MMNASQSSLFDEEPPGPGESLREINDEMLRRVAALPWMSGRIVIPGEGRPGARLALVGESPGPPDAETGRPFMGPAGQMLERILSSIGLRRDECYLTNTVKIISSGDEMTTELLALFTPYLHRELAAVRPRVIVSCGNTPTRALLRTKRPISQLRGEFHDYHGINLMPTFNPAYLLRDPSKKREVWEDMKQVRALLATP